MTTTLQELKYVAQDLGKEPKLRKGQRYPDPAECYQLAGRLLEGGNSADGELHAVLLADMPSKNYSLLDYSSRTSVYLLDPQKELFVVKVRYGRGGAKTPVCMLVGYEAKKPKLD